MAKRERMSSVDTAWLRMDTPTNLMMIVGVLMFSSPVDFARLKRTLEFRLLHYRRFRQKVVHDASGTWWELDSNFDIDSHVLRVSLPGNGGKGELEAYVARQISQSLDRGKPLWQFQYVENYHGGAAIVARFHHCIADGIALMGVLQSLTDASRDAPEDVGHSQALTGPSHRLGHAAALQRQLQGENLIEGLVVSEHASAAELLAGA